MMGAGAYAVLLFGALAGGFVSGLAGFGTALTTLGLWLYVFSPSDAGSLVIICSVVSQSASLPAIWSGIDFKLIWPFILGGLIGTPLGTLLVDHVDPGAFRTGVGLLLLIFPAFLHFNRHPVAFRFGGRLADGAIGLAGGVLGGLAGLSGALPTLWASVRGWGKDERRGIFQTFNWAVLAVALCLRIGSGLITRDVVWYALCAMPCTVLGAWLGARTYRRLSDRNFQNVVLALLFLSGVGLLWSRFG